MFTKFLAVFHLTLILFKNIDGLRIECEFAVDTTSELPIYNFDSFRVFEIEDKVLQSVNGTHVTGYGNSQVDSLSLVFDAHNLTYIPENITVIFPNLKVFTFGSTKIQEISSNDLMQFPNIEIFSSLYNPILSLPGDLFKYNLKLKDVRFYGSIAPSKDNSLSEIGRNLFGNLDQLTTVVFMRHYCMASEFAFNRTEVLDLNERLPVMCPSTIDPTEVPTNPPSESTEGQTTSTTDQPTTEEQKTTTSGQNSKYQSFPFISLLCTFVIFMSV